MSNAVTSIDDLIDALGGTSKVAAWACISHTTVSNWRQRRFVPPGWHLPLLAECARRGIVVDLTKVFGLPEEDAAALSGTLLAVA